ncbi:MAG: hypothetical protein IJ998_01865, partial [Alistipes sp.]|nr:hypothetical protein [Alistipes sp.]
WQGCALPTELFPHYVATIFPDCECKYMANILFCKIFRKNFSKIFTFSIFNPSEGVFLRRLVLLLRKNTTFV